MLRRKYDDIPPGRMMGHSPTWTPGKAAQSLLLPSPVKVLCHWTETLRTLVRKGNLQPKGKEPILMGEILRNLDKLSVGRAIMEFP